MIAIKARRGISGEQIKSIWLLLTVWPRIYHRSRAWREWSVCLLRGEQDSAEAGSHGRFLLKADLVTSPSVSSSRGDSSPLLRVPLPLGVR
jgi:hypothetical protein